MRSRPAGLLFVALISLAGCSASPEDVVSDAVSKTSSEGSAHVVITAETETRNQSFTITGEGDFDYENRRGRGNFDFSELPGAGGETLGDDGIGELRFDGSIYYLKLPFLSQLSPQLSGWMRFDAEELEGANQIAQLGQNDPSQVLSYLNGATGITEKGDEEIAGRPATRYDLTIDYRAGRERADDALEAAYDSIIEDLGVEEAPGSVWIDEDGFVRRLSYEWTIDVPAAGEEEQRVELEFSDFGKSVEIDFPPEEEVTDFNDVFGRVP